jgi:tRNA (guanine37-N1)-methyltransferase
MKFQMITVFPEIITTYLSNGVLSQALKKNLFQCDVLNPRDFTSDRYKSVDDRPFGGGDGMVMLAEVLEETLQSRKEKDDYVIYLSPQGTPLNEKKVQELLLKKNLTLICGRYGGIDQRVINRYVDEEISIGDYVLSGGELAAMVVMDTLVRKIPGVLGHQDSASLDSFAIEGLEHPLFTRPQEWNGEKVPTILTSGHHEKIAFWKKNISRLVTLKKRPDLLKIQTAEKIELKKFWDQLSAEEKRACGLEDLHEF